MDADAHATARRRLENEKVSLERQLTEHGATIVGEGTEVQVSVDEGFADSAQATAERSELLAIVDQLRTAYRDVVRALERIEGGTYGRCERCGNEIPPERLEALPTAGLCMSCKQLLAGV
jgi:RNA polymerase-binding transcription factor DksA